MSFGDRLDGLRRRAEDAIRALPPDSTGRGGAEVLGLFLTEETSALRAIAGAAEDAIAAADRSKAMNGSEVAAMEKPPGSIDARDRLLKEFADLEEQASALANDLAPILRPSDHDEVGKAVDPGGPKQTIGSDFHLSLVDVRERIWKTSRLIADTRRRLDL